MKPYEIHVLDNETVNKIAAGEVVERPLSVIKELVENAIDAHSSSITVEIENGGIEFIRVTDNGAGIPMSEIRKAFLRHATSKIAIAEDLTHINTLGFRGEALSSIAAVAKVELISKTEDELTGCRYLIEGGIEKSYEEIGAPNGTTFLIRNLFYNTPVRRKFLKSGVTEGNYISDLMERFALSHPEISFHFTSNHKLKFSTSGNGNQKEVIYRIYGRETCDESIQIHSSETDISMTGYLGKPVINRANRNFETFFVNGRYVKSELLWKAVEEGYNGFLMQHKYPFCIINISINTDKIDVNVHPNKLDIRFSDQQAVYNTILSYVHDALANQELIPKTTLYSASEERENLREEQNILREETPKYVPQPFETNRIMKEIIQKKTENKVYGVDTSTKVLKNESLHANVIKGNEHIIVEKNTQISMFDDQLLKIDFESQYEIVGQVFDTYWIISVKDELLFIDQHAAHEKVKYEQFIAHLENNEVETQELNPPVIIKLTSLEYSTFHDYEEYFTKLGFTIEDFGGDEFAIRTVPLNLYGYSEKDMFIEILDELATKPIHSSPDIILQKIASMSCKAAVKGNHTMSDLEAKELIHELLKLKNPYNCPHGRPVIVSMSKNEMERKFKRIVN